MNCSIARDVKEGKKVNKESRSDMVLPCTVVMPCVYKSCSMHSKLTPKISGFCNIR